MRLRLTGGYAMDKADGSGTMLFDLASRDWPGEVLEALRIDPAWMRLRDGLDLMIETGMPAPGVIRASGGGAASPLWRQVLADVLGAEIATVDTAEGAAFGAGLLAAVGAGWFPTVEAAAAALVTATPAAVPGPDAPRYAEVHAIYRGLYPALAPLFQRM